MHTITYVSSAVRPFTGEELLRLLEKSRLNNLSHGVTGMLLYHRGTFMQAIEGPPDAIHRLYANIRRDPTHRGIITLIDEPCETREFARWEMGFRDTSNLDLSLVPAFVDVTRSPANDAEWTETRSHARTLLRSFLDRAG